jgi:hypothetical protein
MIGRNRRAGRNRVHYGVNGQSPQTRITQQGSFFVLTDPVDLTGALKVI